MADNCLAVNGDGVAYRELSCVYPQLDPFYLQYVSLFCFILFYFIGIIWSSSHLWFFVRFEKKYDPMDTLHLMSQHNMIPVFAVLAYAVLIFGGQHLMTKREPWNWRRAMAAWNLFLSVFSWIGMFRTLPQLAHNLMTMSVRDNLCLDPRSTYGSGSSGLWVQLFILSKFP